MVGVAVVGGDEAGAAALVDGGDDPAQAAVHGLDRRTAAGMTPVWPTMSAFAKLMMPKRKPPSLTASANASAGARALISGF